MPVIIPTDRFARLLDPDAGADELKALLVPADPAGWESFAVGKAVNYARNEGPGLIEPADLGQTLFG